MSAAERLARRLDLGAGRAVVLHNPSNMFYITEGYTGEGVVYVSGSKTVIITDFRYTEQAGRQAPAFEVVMTDKSVTHSQWISRLCDQDGINTLYFEDEFLTVKSFAKMKAELGEGVSCVPVNNVPEELRVIKTDREIACIREACVITSKAFDMILPKIHEGITEKELQIELDLLQLNLGAQCNSFDTIMAFGENGSLCHAIPGQRKLKKGDMITMDFGCKVGGYCSDMTRTVAFGEPSDIMRRVYTTVQRVQAETRALVAPGKSCYDVDKFARDSIDQADPMFVGRMGHGLGHCVGIDIHENPRFSQLCFDTTQAGMVITVEPGIYLPGIGGVRIEDTVLITETGYESLTTAPRDLIIL